LAVEVMPLASAAAGRYFRIGIGMTAEGDDARPAFQRPTAR
jgi:hypothetical protein